MLYNSIGIHPSLARGRLRRRRLLNHLLDESCLDELVDALSDSPNLSPRGADLTLCEGFIELRCRPLDGRAVCAAMIVDGVLWIFIDPDKPNALGQARDMLDEWRASYLHTALPTIGSRAPAALG